MVVLMMFTWKQLLLTLEMLIFHNIRSCIKKSERNLHFDTFDLSYDWRSNFTNVKHGTDILISRFISGKDGNWATQAPIQTVHLKLRS